MSSFFGRLFAIYMGLATATIYHHHRPLVALLTLAIAATIAYYWEAF